MRPRFRRLCSRHNPAFPRPCGRARPTEWGENLIFDSVKDEPPRKRTIAPVTQFFSSTSTREPGVTRIRFITAPPVLRGVGADTSSQMMKAMTK